jgi:hypothetical protein
MRLLAAGIILALAANADVITLKNGRIVNGTYLGGTPRQIKVEVGDEIETLDVSDISRIEFNNGSYSSSRSDSRSDDSRPTLRRSGASSSSGGPVSGPIMIQPDPSDPRTQSGSGGGGGGYDSNRPTLRRSTGSTSDTAPSQTQSASSQSDDSSRPTLRRAPGSDADASARQSTTPAPAAQPEATAAQPAPAQPATVQIPAQTSVVVRMIEAIDSKTAKEGQTFTASLDQPIAVNGQTILPAGADATVKLVQAQQSGAFTGKTVLTVSLWSVSVNGKTVEINTQNITEASDSRGAKTAKVAGGAAAVGAVIGAVAGGGKGAAVGAGAGAAGGAAVQAATKGERVKIPSETRLTFVLEKPVTL